MFVTAQKMICFQNTLTKSNNFYDMRNYNKIPTYLIPNTTPIGSSIAKFLYTKNDQTNPSEGAVPDLQLGQKLFHLKEHAIS